MPLTLFLIELSQINARDKTNEYDLTIVGSVNFNLGLGRIALEFLKLIYENLEINFINTGYYNSQNISGLEKSIIERNDSIKTLVKLLF